MLHSPVMKLKPAERRALIRAIASREGNARELSERFGYSTKDLRAFVAQNRSELEEARQALEAYKVGEATGDESAGVVTPTQLDELWITNKFQRLRRLQELAEIQYQDAAHGDLVGVDLSTALREFRSYLTLAANELGQLLHRGSGDAGTGDVLSVEFEGVDTDNLK